MTQSLRALAAHPEDPGSIPNTHMELQGIRPPHTDIHADKAPMHVKENKF